MNDLINQKGSSLMVVIATMAMSVGLSLMMASLNTETNTATKKQISQISLNLWKKNILYPAFKTQLHQDNSGCNSFLNNTFTGDFQESRVTSLDLTDYPTINDALSLIPSPYSIVTGNEDGSIWLQRVAFRQEGEDSLVGRCDLRIHLKSKIKKVGLSDYFIIIPVHCEMDQNQADITSCDIGEQPATTQDSEENLLWRSTENYIYKDGPILIGDDNGDETLGANLKISFEDLPSWPLPSSDIKSGIKLNGENRALIFNEKVAIYEQEGCFKIAHKNQESSGPDQTNELSTTSSFCSDNTLMNTMNSTVLGDQSLILGGKNVNLQSANSIVSGENLVVNENAQYSFILGKNTQSDASYSFAMGNNLSILSQENAIVMGENLKLGINANNSFLFGYAPLSSSSEEDSAPFELNQSYTFAAYFTGGFTFETDNNLEANELGQVSIDSQGNMGIGKDLFELETSEYPTADIPKLLVNGTAQFSAEIWKNGKDQEGSAKYLLEKPNENSGWLTPTYGSLFTESTPPIRLKKHNNVLYLKGKLKPISQSNINSNVSYHALTLPIGFRFEHKGFLYIPQTNSQIDGANKDFCKISLQSVGTNGIIWIEFFGDNLSEHDPICSFDGISLPVDL